jgi:predicted nuclease of predicted toxin-antitoxin system
VRFFCDQHVDVAVAAMLRELGHEAWTAANAGLTTAADDDLTVYAIDKGACLITHDEEFSRRRQRNVIGQHVWLRCNEWDAADVLRRNPDWLEPLLANRRDVWVRLSREGRVESYAWE